MKAVRNWMRSTLVAMPALVGVLLSIPAAADRRAETNWRADPLMIANISLSSRSISLKDVCRTLERQTSVEFHVDRRFEDFPVALQLRSVRLETAMTCVEEAAGLQWRLIDDMFFLTKDARGTAVVRWKERYEEARKTHVAETTRSRVQEWLYDVMPFPPAFDYVWNLTPLQREQIAYLNALNVATMTGPQLDWLNYALLSKGFSSPDARVPTDLLVQKAPELEIRMNTAMVIDSPQGVLIVEKPLATPQPKPSETATEPAKVDAVTVTEQNPVEKTALKGSLDGIWIGDEKPVDLVALLRTAKARNFDNIFIPVLSRGQTIYPSKALNPDADEPKGPDRLRAIVDIADRLGLRVHAVIDTTLWGDATHPAPPPAKRTVVQDRNLLDRTYTEQAQWQQTESAALNSNSTAVTPANDKSVYLCPASSQTARLIKAVAEEIAGGYDVAGICLDRLEYPRAAPFVVNGREMAVPFGYTIEVRKEMIRAHQLDPIDIHPEGTSDVEERATWDKFRRGKLTGLIAEVAAAFKAIKPEGICSVTLDPQSDSQSPGHWARLSDLDALLPSVKIDATDTGLVEEQEDVQAVGALYASVSKYSAVAPVIRATDRDRERLIDFASALTSPKPHRGWVLYGSTSELAKLLEGLTTTGDQ